jgi:GNAT superfamily N-acetyltransferase
VESLHPDLLFSTFGASELARVTLPYGFGVWGPAWLLFADEASWRPIEDDRPVQLNRPELAGVDYDIFWHCEADGPLAGFGIFEDGRLVALATVRDDGDPVWEIGMDVAPDSKGRGLGRAVVNAAGRWILENGRLILATTAPFNVPSTRTLRSLGLRYLLSEMKGREGLFQVPPQPLGSPYPGAKVYDYYPRWAMNQGIQPRPGS